MVNASLKDYSPSYLLDDTHWHTPRETLAILPPVGGPAGDEAYLTNLASRIDKIIAMNNAS